MRNKYQNTLANPKAQMNRKYVAIGSDKLLARENKRKKNEKNKTLTTTKTQPNECAHIMPMYHPAFC